MKRLLSIFACAMFLAAVPMSAQLKFGLKGGVNLANVAYSGAPVDFDTKNLVGFHVGPMLEIGVTEKIGVNVSALLSSLGAKSETTLLGTTIEASNNPMYIQVPALLVYRGDMFYLGAGPYAGFGIGGNSKIGDETSKIKFGTDDNSDLSPSDFGLHFEAGLNLMEHYRIGLAYGLGLANTVPKDLQIGDFTGKNQNIMVTLGYIF